MTPKQFKKALDAYTRKQKMDAVEQDALNHSLGAYIRIAFNDPKKYPKKPFLDKILEDEKNERDENHQMTSTEMERVMRANTIKLGGKIIKNESSN